MRRSRSGNLPSWKTNVSRKDSSARSASIASSLALILLGSARGWQSHWRNIRFPNGVMQRLRRENRVPSTLPSKELANIFKGLLTVFLYEFYVLLTSRFCSVCPSRTKLVVFLIGSYHEKFPMPTNSLSTFRCCR